jgi:hypothetical protein
MKACPTCQRTYTDESLTFCLVDGSVLSDPYDPNQTLQMPEPRTTDSPINRPPAQSTILAVQPSNLHAAKQLPRTEKKRGVNLWLAIGLGLTSMVLVVALVVIGFLWSKESKPDTRRRPNGNLTEASPSPFASPSATTEVLEGWERHEDTSINEGDRITFYPGTTGEQCQDDCEQNAKCKAYTFIRAGAYNANDPPMCYLMSAVKTLNPSTCCFTAIKR